ncbi:MAG TPA: competence protein CoiA family protein [Methylotenera sp.]
MPKLVIAQHTSGRMIGIKEASNGLACDCTCSCCGDRLVARQGKQKDWSFAHESGADCAGAIESALHKAAKQILAEEKSLYIGEYDPILASHPGFFSDIKYAIDHYPQMKDFRGPVETSFYRLAKEELVDRVLSVQRICAINRLELSSVVTEVAAEGSERIPDATVITKNGNRMYVEFVVTNECDEDKIEELIRLGIPTIQINLKQLRNYEFSLDDIKHVIVNGQLPGSRQISVFREWLVKPKYIQDAEQHANEFIRAATIKMAGWKEEQKTKLDALKGQRSKLLFMNSMVAIEQHESWATVWLPPSAVEDVLTELTAIMGQMRATYLNSYWSVRGNDVKERFLEVAEQREQDRIVRMRAISHVYEPDFRFELEIQDLDVSAEIEMKIKEEARRLVVKEANEKREKVIAEVMERHKGIVDHEGVLNFV